MNALDFYGNPGVAESYFLYAQDPSKFPCALFGLSWLKYFLGSQSGNGKILVDFGYGPGTSTKTFSRLKFQKYFCIDGSQAMLDIAELYLSGLDVSFQKKDLSVPFTVELQDSSVDVVTICNVLNSLSDPFLCLEESMRILKPNGFLLCNFTANLSTEHKAFIEEDGMVSYVHSQAQIEKFITKNNLKERISDKLPEIEMNGVKIIESLFLFQK